MAFEFKGQRERLKYVRNLTYHTTSLLLNVIDVIPSDWVYVHVEKLKEGKTFARFRVTHVKNLDDFSGVKLRKISRTSKAQFLNLYGYLPNDWAIVGLDDIVYGDGYVEFTVRLLVSDDDIRKLGVRNGGKGSRSGGEVAEIH
jgi:hypothetical protein